MYVYMHTDRTKLFVNSKADKQLWVYSVGYLGLSPQDGPTLKKKGDIALKGVADNIALSIGSYPQHILVGQTTGRDGENENGKASVSKDLKVGSFGDNLGQGMGTGSRGDGDDDDDDEGDTDEEGGAAGTAGAGATKLQYGPLKSHDASMTLIPATGLFHVSSVVEWNGNAIFGSKYDAGLVVCPTTPKRPPEDESLAVPMPATKQGLSGGLIFVVILFGAIVPIISLSVVLKKSGYGCDLWSVKTLLTLPKLGSGKSKFATMDEFSNPLEGGASGAYAGGEDDEGAMFANPLATGSNA